MVSSEEPEDHQPKSKIRNQQPEDADKILSRNAPHMLQKPPDDYDRFGEDVAMELRNLESPIYRKKNLNGKSKRQNPKESVGSTDSIIH